MKLTKKGEAILKDLVVDLQEPVEIIHTFTIRKGSLRGYRDDTFEPLYYGHSLSYIRYYIPRTDETWEYIEEHDTRRVLCDKILQKGHE